jgi:hypothetical protein
MQDGYSGFSCPDLVVVETGIDRCWGIFAVSLFLRGLFVPEGRKVVHERSSSK